jgi:hypothetical protein
MTWANSSKRKGRPAKGGLFFQGRIVLNGGNNPPKLSGEILRAARGGVKKFL